MSDPVRGKTIRWSYDDGPVAGKTFEHTFTADGTVSWREPGTTSGGEPSVPYQATWITDDVYLVSYLAASGWTLTTLVDTTSGKIVSVASNEKELVIQRGLALRQDDHRGRELKPRRDRREVREQRERLVEERLVRVWPGPASGSPRVRAEDVVVAHPLELARVTRDRSRLRADLELREDRADLQGRSSRSGRAG